MNTTARVTYFLDSSTLIHAIDRSAEYHKECLNIITKAAKGQMSTATSLETLEETLFILSKLTTTATALNVTHDFLKMTKIKKNEMTSSIFEHTLEIIELTPLKRPKDAINVATMLENNIQKIISEDKEYDKVSLIQRVHPKDI
jgi:predicted nucleic acid-binding protein